MLFASKKVSKAGCLSLGIIVCGTLGFNIGKFSG